MNSPIRIIMIGATGAVGTEVLKNLVVDARVDSINLFDVSTYENELPGAQVAISTFGVGQPSQLDFILVQSASSLRSVKVDRLGRSIAANVFSKKSNSVEILKWKDFQQIV
jgi:hypothetical protein